MNVQHFYKSRWLGEDFRSSCAQPGLTLYGSSFKSAQQPPLRTYIEKDVMTAGLFLGSWFAFSSLKKQSLRWHVLSNPRNGKLVSQFVSIQAVTLFTGSPAEFRTRCLGRLRLPVGFTLIAPKWFKHWRQDALYLSPHFYK